MPQTPITMKKRGVPFPLDVFSTVATGYYYVYVNNLNVACVNIHFSHSRLSLYSIPVEIGDTVHSGWGSGAQKESDSWEFIPYVN